MQTKRKRIVRGTKERENVVMADTAKYMVEKELGCGFMGGIFQCLSRPRKSTVYLLPSSKCSNLIKPSRTEDSEITSTLDCKRITSSSVETASAEKYNSAKTTQKLEKKPNSKLDLVHHRPSVSHQRIQGRRSLDAARSSTCSSNGSSQTRISGVVKLRRASTSDFPQLSRIITNHHQFDESKALVRASSDNVRPIRHLGNLKKIGSSSTTKTKDGTSRNNKEMMSLSHTKHVYGIIGSNGSNMGNIVMKNSGEFRGFGNKLDPEHLKSLGNEAYKKGNFEEALSLYEQAIALDSTKATYHSNKSAALIGLGCLIEAIAESNEAIRIEPSYHRAHHRLASLYIRLGEAEKALYHYKHSGPYAELRDVDIAKALHKCLCRCTEAQERSEWKILLSETKFAVSTGASSAPQVFALQTEAFLKLLRHEEAYTTYQKGPNFSIDACTEFFGLTCTAYILLIRSQVFLAAGRFDEAVEAAQNAGKLDSNKKAINVAIKTARAVALARSNGNILFKAEKFSKACLVYSQGLEHDSHNSVLLCNRAACRSKLGQFEKAIEDCTSALNLRPAYSKARLRRADCNAKLERWGAAIQDYEVLLRETPGDEEVGRALFDARIQLKRQHGEDIKDMKFGSNLFIVSSTELFRHTITSPGMSVVLFCNKAKQNRLLQVLEQVCKRFPTVNFLKVEVEEYPYLAKTEGVKIVPTFKIYKNGSRVQEIPGNKHQLLESSVKLYSG